MKKLIVLLLCALLLVGALGGCKKNDPDVNITWTQPGDDGTNGADGADEQDPVSEIPPHDFALPDGNVESFVNLVANFNVAPVEFRAPSELGDETLVFTAATYLGAEFTLNEDGFSYSLPLAELEAGVARMFGGLGTLSPDYKTKDYIPYQIDAENDVIVRYPGSGVGSYYFNYALVELDSGGYELWLIDLMDPLYFSNTQNNDYLLSGGTVTYDMISDIAPEMQYNVYTLRQSDSGDYYLAAFRYHNFKNINHFIF